MKCPGCVQKSDQDINDGHMCPDRTEPANAIVLPAGVLQPMLAGRSALARVMRDIEVKGDALVKHLMAQTSALSSLDHSIGLDIAYVRALHGLGGPKRKTQKSM